MLGSHNWRMLRGPHQPLGPRLGALMGPLCFGMLCPGPRNLHPPQLHEQKNKGNLKMTTQNESYKGQKWKGNNNHVCTRHLFILPESLEELRVRFVHLLIYVAHTHFLTKDIHLFWSVPMNINLIWIPWMVYIHFWSI